MTWRHKLCFLTSEIQHFIHNISMKCYVYHCDISIKGRTKHLCWRIHVIKWKRCGTSNILKTAPLRMISSWIRSKAQAVEDRTDSGSCCFSRRLTLDNEVLDVPLGWRSVLHFEVVPTQRPAGHTSFSSSFFLSLSVCLSVDSDSPQCGSWILQHMCSLTGTPNTPSLYVYKWSSNLACPAHQKPTRTHTHTRTNVSVTSE